MRILEHVVALGIATLALASCNGAASSSSGPLGLAQSAPQISEHSGACPCLYVADNDSNSVTVYPLSSNPKQPPTQVISGSNTGLSLPSAVAVDKRANIYVTNLYSKSVTIYAAGSTGNVAPTATISGKHTLLNWDLGIALNPVNGDIYVANELGGSTGDGYITIYRPHSNGDVRPIGSITGPATELAEPVSVALDASGKIYVSNSVVPNSTVTVYAAGSLGNVAPIQVIGGSNTGLYNPYGIAVDSSLNLYVANFEENSITIYAAGSNGNVAPMATISGNETKLDFPYGLAVDKHSKVYVSEFYRPNPSNPYLNEVLRFAADANGNVKPGETRNVSPYWWPEGIAIR